MDKFRNACAALHTYETFTTAERGGATTSRNAALFLYYIDIERGNSAGCRFVSEPATSLRVYNKVYLDPKEPF